METRIENTDGGPVKLAAAAASMAKWFRREDTVLRRAIAIGQEHLAANPDDTETAASVAELQRQRQELHRGWENSSVRKAIGERGETATVMGAESRSIAMRGFSLPAESRAAGSATRTTKLVGYAAVTNQEAEIGGYFIEVISAGAFRDVLDGDTIFNFNHSPDMLLARTPRSLRLVEDTRGLRIEADMMSRDPLSSAMRRRILAGILAKMSFAFSDVTDEWQLAAGPGGLDRRRILKIGRLWDVSVVTWPAYQGTSIWVVDGERTAASDAEPVTADEYFADADEHIGRVDRLDALQARLRAADPRRRRVDAALARLRRSLA